MLRKFNYSKADIEKVLASLLVDDEKLGKWHSPKGVFERKRDAITLHFNKAEGWVIRHIAKKHNMTVVELTKWMFVHYFFKKYIPQELMLKADNYCPVKTRQWLYGFAIKQIKKVDPEEPKKRIKITKKLLKEE